MKALFCKKCGGAIRIDEVRLATDWDSAVAGLSTDLPGDFDLSGNVDGHDFLVWQRNTSIGDLADWQSNYGNPLRAVSSAAVVPEPTSLILLIWASLGMPRRQP